MVSGTSLTGRITGTDFKRAHRAADFHFFARFTTPPGYAGTVRILRIISEVEF